MVQRQTPQQIVDRILELPDGTRFQVLAPVVRGRKGEYQSLLEELAGQGFARARIDGEIYELSDPPKLARYEIHTIEVVVDRLVKREGIERRLTDSLETALRLAEGVAEVQLVAREDEPPLDDDTLTFSQHLACPTCGLSFDELAPAQLQLQLAVRVPAPTATGWAPASRSTPTWWCVTRTCPSRTAPSPPGAGRAASTSAGCWRPSRRPTLSPRQTPWRNLKKSDQKVVLYGTGTKKVHVQYRNRYGRVRSYDTQYEGVVPWLARRYAEAESDHSRETIEGYMREVPCPACGGARLKPESLAVTVAGRNIFELCDLSLGDATGLMNRLELSERDHLIADRVLKEIQARMQFLLDVGLDYLSLNRSAGTLAGGEAQRIRLASQIGSGLVGRAVRARRAVDRAAPAGQPQADRDPAAPAGPRQHRDRGGARRGHHPGGRPRGRHRPGGGRARRADRGVGTGQRPAQDQGVAHRPVPHPQAAASRCRRCAASPRGC